MHDHNPTSKTESGAAVGLCRTAEPIAAVMLIRLDAHLIKMCNSSRLSRLRYSGPGVFCFIMQYTLIESCSRPVTCAHPCCCLSKSKGRRCDKYVIMYVRLVKQGHDPNLAESTGHFHVTEIQEVYIDSRRRCALARREVWRLALIPL
jgi:hypothetical protein